MTGDQEEAQRNRRGYPRLYRSFLTYSLIRAGFPGRLSKGDNVRYSCLKKKKKSKSRRGDGGDEVCDVNVNVTERRRANRLCLTPDAGADQIRRNLGFFFLSARKRRVSAASFFTVTPPRRGTLTLFGSGMITYPLFVQCPSDTSRSSPAYAFFQYEKRVQAKAPCVQHAADLFHWLCFC